MYRGIDKLRSKWASLRQAGFSVEYISRKYGLSESQITRGINIFLTDQQIGLAKLNACPFGDVCRTAGMTQAQTRSLYNAINRWNARK